MTETFLIRLEVGGTAFEGFKTIPAQNRYLPRVARGILGEATNFSFGKVIELSFGNIRARRGESNVPVEVYAFEANRGRPPGAA